MDDVRIQEVFDKLKSSDGVWMQELTAQQRGTAGGCPARVSSMGVINAGVCGTSVRSTGV